MLISTVASKLHKIPSTTVNSDDTTTFNSGFPPPLSADAISNPISNPISDPSSNSTSGVVHLAKAQGSHKTWSSLAESQSGLLPHAVGPSCHTKATTSRCSSNNTSAETSSLIIIHNMQGSINMLTATVQDSVVVDTITKVHQDTV